MTDINTLKKWFTTGSKPTQDQFWATFDSFYHKDERIAMSNVEGLDTALSFKAEAKTLASYARLDASNLKDADAAIWKTKLGVGSLPPNIATYDPAKVNYVMMKDGTDKPAGDLGKNMANSALTTVAGAGVTQGANYTWSTAGYYLYLTGTPDKSRDSTFNKMLVLDANGQVASSSGAPIIQRVGLMLPDVSGDGNYNKVLVSDANGNTGLGDATNIVSSLQSATQAEINTLFNILGGNYQGMISPVVNSIFPPVIPYVNGLTQEITLYGKGLNILNDPLTSSVKIIDTSTNNSYSVGYNSISGNQLKIFVLSNFIAHGREYKVQITNGVMNYQSILSFKVVDALAFEEVTLNDSLWNYIELNSAKIATNGKLSLLNSVFTAPQKPTNAVSIEASSNVNAYYEYDFSGKISNTDNFSINFNLKYSLSNRYWPETRDSIGLAFIDKSKNLAPTQPLSQAAYGIYYGFQKFILPHSTFPANAPGILICNVTITRDNGLVTSTATYLQGMSESYSVSTIPISIQNLKMVVDFSFYDWSSQLEIKKLIKW